MMDALLSWRPDTWLEYLITYLIPGALMAGYLLIKTWLEKPSDFAKSVMKMMNKEATFLDKLKEAGVYSLGISCVLIGWPGFVVWFFKAKQDEAHRQKRYAEPDFNCLPQHLITKVDPIDAETASYVIDPLRTVPPKPFGHLNSGWVNFLADMSDERDETWSFYVPKGDKCGKHGLAASSNITGYAKVRDGKILGEFITESD
jgi:hypothetical protein